MTVAYRDIISRNIDAPTKERFEQGGFELRQLEKGEGKVLVATDPTPLLKAHSKGKLTDRQCDAGLWYDDPSRLTSVLRCNANVFALQGYVSEG